MSGSFVRFVEIESIQTLYNMTKNPSVHNKYIKEVDVMPIIKKDPKDITFEYLVDLFSI